MMMQAVLNGTVIAESDKTVVVEGNHYFPAEDVNADYLQSSGTHTTCPWKGIASYYTVAVPGTTSEDAAWYYPTPSPAAQEITDRVAFWRGVTVLPEPFGD
jgi:uncharacterized protein (DUF427 family)